MDRRSFFRMIIGGVAAAAAVRTFPFRVFSFPAEIVTPSPAVQEFATIYYSREAMQTLVKNLRFSDVRPFKGKNFHAIVHPIVWEQYNLRAPQGLYVS